MANDQTVLYAIKEADHYMMGFVIVTREDNVIVIDGGFDEDMPELKRYIGGRHISAWILTHAHEDHISGLVHELSKNGGKDFDIEKIYYNFPPYDELINNHDVPDYPYYEKDLNEMLPEWNALLPKIKDKTHIVSQGESLSIDEVKIDFIFTYHEGIYSNFINDTSLVFKLTTPNKTVLFLGDLGADGGDMLFRESRHLLKADIVQMSHHGHMNVGMEVYAEIMPEECIWCCPEWIYEEDVIPFYSLDLETTKRMKRVRLYGAALTRKWMDILGAKKHYVTKDGTQKIVL